MLIFLVWLSCKFLIFFSDSKSKIFFFETFFRQFEKTYIDFSVEICLELRVEIFILNQCWRFFVIMVMLGRSTTTRRKRRKQGTQKEPPERFSERREGLGRLVPGGSAESEAGHHNQAIPTRVTCRDISRHVYTISPSYEYELC